MPASRSHGMDQDFYPWSPIVTRPILNLNAPGRVQTKKRRPALPMADWLRPWIKPLKDTSFRLPGEAREEDCRCLPVYAGRCWIRTGLNSVHSANTPSPAELMAAASLNSR